MSDSPIRIEHSSAETTWPEGWHTFSSESRYTFTGTAEGCAEALDQLASAAKALGFWWGGDWTMPCPRGTDCPNPHHDHAA